MQVAPPLPSPPLPSGYVPEMRLYSSRPSQPWEVESEVNTTDEGVDPDSLAWDQEVSLEQARLTLEKVLYPFKTVSMMNLLYKAK